METESMYKHKYLSSWDSIRGRTEGQPFIRGMGGSFYFRIPGIISLDNGWILASADVRWITTLDSPHNIDAAYSLSKDGGNTWDYEFFNHFVDHHGTSSSRQSASLIDPAITQASDGTIHYIVDAFPAYGGLMYGNRMGSESTGFDKEGRIYIQKSKSNTSASTNISDYKYRLDFNGEFIEQEYCGQIIKLWPITADEDATETYVDAWYNTYTVNGNTVEAHVTQQFGSDELIQNNIFYFQSEWKIYPVSYLLHRNGQVKESGIEWSLPKLIDHKLAAHENFTGLCPGRGLSFTYENEDYNIFALYDNSTGTERASTIRLEGDKWVRGERAIIDNGFGKSSESQLVKLNGPTIRMYMRNDIDKISYVDSGDFGQTWSAYKVDEDLEYSSNCMVSFINLPGKIVAKDNKTYDNLIAASYPAATDKFRSDGVIRIGAIEENNDVTWLNSNETLIPGFFAYSCLAHHTEENETKLLLMYEYGEAFIRLEKFDINDLLPDGLEYIS